MDLKPITTLLYVTTHFVIDLRFDGTARCDETAEIFVFDVEGQEITVDL
jgi:hypothetical protein